MEPVSAELRNGEWTIRHRCTSCGFERRSKTVPEDSFDAILRLSIA
jgi:hypothetical protein